MGMFSWLCKGCGHELNKGEWVKVDGRRQVYDGYGGSAAEYGDAIAWHCRCYDLAPVEEKLAETMSPSAPDQGMGFAKLEFMQGYDPSAPTTYSAIVYCRYFDVEKRLSYEWQLHLTDKGLEDEKDYQRRLETVFETISAERPEDWWKDILKKPQEELEALNAETSREAERRMGGPSPYRRTLQFSSIDECLAAVDRLIPSGLPEDVEGVYHLAIFGTQGEIDGVVYERHVRHAWDRTGGYENWKKLDHLETTSWRTTSTT